MLFPDIREVKNLQGKRVLLRADLDVPTKDGNITNTYRLDKASNTICFLVEAGARVIVVGHIGRDVSNSLRGVYDYMQTHTVVDSDWKFVSENTGTEVTSVIEKMKDSDVVMLENLRKDKREILNDDTFAETLASYAEMYIDDAFSVAHREHASVVGISRYLPSYFGIQFLYEVHGLTPALSPSGSSLCILGGAKLGTKEPLIQKFVDVYDTVFVCGALSNDFFRLRGYETGRSIVSPALPDLSGLLNNEKIGTPVDVVVENKGIVSVKKPQDVVSGDYIYDAGPETGKQLAKLVGNTSFVLWNGPLGQYEDGYDTGTKTLAYEIAHSNTNAVVGGGNTVDAVSDVRVERDNLFLSGAGGAMLTFLLNGTLPGIEAVQKSIQ